MLAIAARQMGYRVATLSPDRDSPLGQIADREIVAEYDDLDAVRAFAAGKVAHHKIPRYVLVVDEYPMTVSGKVRKVDMRATSIELLGLGAAAAVAHA